jgi:hypothetical protein
VKLTIVSPTVEQIRSYIGWQYIGPYALYNLSAEDEAAEVDFFLDPENGYFAILDDEGTLLGFCNFGADARVPGGDYSDEAVDIGMGMRPDLTGKGKGALYAAAVFDFAKTRYSEKRHRVTIAEFNVCDHGACSLEVTCCQGLCRSSIKRSAGGNAWQTECEDGHLCSWRQNDCSYVSS